MNFISSLFINVLNVFMMIVMLRMWLQYCRADFYHSLSQTVVKLTDPLLMPLRKTLKPKRNVDIAALLLVFILGFVKLPLLSLLNGSFDLGSMISGFPILFSVAALSVPKIFGEMLLYILFVGAILSWFRRGNDSFAYLLYQLGEPVLKPIRNILPKTGMIDFSPMVVAFILLGLNQFMFSSIPGIWMLV